MLKKKLEEGSIMDMDELGLNEQEEIEKKKAEELNEFEDENEDDK